jgi:predicted transport protein
MSDIKLFRVKDDHVEPLEGHSVALEKSLQERIERHLETLFGVRFLATEYSTGKTHGGRIDTLGIDENGCPVIIEYKRASNENVINQGLFYLDWLMDHKAELELLVLKTLGQAAADSIEWTSPRLLCIAGDFTKYDEHAVQQINRNIELIRYRYYGDELLLFELVNAVTATGSDTGSTGGGSGTTYRSVSDNLKAADQAVRDVYEGVRTHLLSLGDDVTERTLKFYFAFRRIKNFACVEVGKSAGVVKIYVKVNPGEIDLDESWMRDVRDIGHFGTGDLELTLRTMDDIEKAKPFLMQSYEAS